MFVDNNAGRLQGWLDQIAHGVQDPDTKEYLVAPNPEKAFQLFQTVIEYHVPKLARTELTGANGGPVQYQKTPEERDAEIARLLSAATVATK